MHWRIRRNVSGYAAQYPVARRDAIAQWLLPYIRALHAVA